MADISKITIPVGTTYNIKDATLRNNIDNIKVGGRNYILNSFDYANWGSSNGVTFINGDSNLTKIISYPTVTTNTWRLAWPTQLLPYSLIRNKTITQSCLIKATSGTTCALNMSLGLTSASNNVTRLKYRNIQKVFTGTDNWLKIIDTVTIIDSFFSSGTNSPDYDNCYFIIRPGAWYTYWNGFELKKYQLEIENYDTGWRPAPEDAATVVNSQLKFSL